MKTKKILIILLTMIMLTNSFAGINISNATNEKQILTIKEGTDYGTTIKEHNAPLRFVRTYYEGNGGIYPVYCLDKSLPGVAELPVKEYDIEVSDKITDLRLWRVIVNSYPYKNFLEMGCDTPSQAFVATKAVIDIILYNKNIEDYSAINSDGEIILRAMKTLIELSEDESIMPPSSKIDIIPTNEWQFEKLNNKLYIARTFTVDNDNLDGRYTVGLRGYIPTGTIITDLNNIQKTNFQKTENFKILIPSDKVNKKDTISISVQGDVTTYPIYKGVPINREYQPYLITGIRNELGQGEKEIEYEPIGGELIIIKKDAQTNERLSNVKFNVYDSNKKLIFENLKTDSNGEIIISNLLTGNYYVEETKAPDGYEIIEGLHDIRVIEGSTSKLIMNNSKKIVHEEEKHNIVVEIVENNTENNTITENEYHKQETNNNVENNTEINNTYIDKTNNNEVVNNTENNNFITNTNNNETENNKTQNTTTITDDNSKITENILNNKKLPKTGM